MNAKTNLAGTRRGFTLMELLVAILVIFALMGLLIVGARHVRKLAKGSRDTAAVSSLKQAATQFRSATGFLPPLVKDQQPLAGGKPSIYNNQTDGVALRNAPSFHSGADVDERFSLYSIPYYLIGALEAPGASPNTPLDGVAGPGFLMPKRDGTFERSGRKFDSFFDIGRDGRALFQADAANGRVVLRDANEVAFRYYRWLRGDPPNTPPSNPPRLNVPDIFVTDPSGKPDPEFRNADWAIVGAGPNGVFGDEADISQFWNPPFPGGHPQAMSWADLAAKVGVSGNVQGDPALQAKVRNAARADNIVEVGSDK